MGEILTGTASWTDPTLLRSGWYPSEAGSAEAGIIFQALASLITVGLVVARAVNILQG